MITTEDSKIHIYDGIELVQKYKGTPFSYWKNKRIYSSM